MLPKWQGQCPDCKSWNSVEELPTIVGASQSNTNWHGKATSSNSILLSEVPVTDTPRFSSEISELDRVLGGGLVRGSVILLGGDPGIGKSTILLQCLAKISVNQNAL